MISGGFEKLFGGSSSGGYAPPAEQMQSLGGTIYDAMQGGMGARGAKPQFGYKPGDSGYGFGGSVGTKPYQPFQASGARPHDQFKFSSPDLKSRVAPHYAGIESSAIEGAKSGARSGMESGMSMLGRRGVGRGGLAGMEVMQGSGALGRDISNIRRDVGFQKAGALSEIDQMQAQMDMERQARQAGEGQFFSQFGEGQRQYNAGLGARERQFGASIGQQQRQQAIQEMLGQYQADAGVRGEQRAAYQSPLQQLMQLYSTGLQAQASQSSSTPGVFGAIGGAAEGVGSMFSPF